MTSSTRVRLLFLNKEESIVKARNHNRLKQTPFSQFLSTSLILHVLKIVCRHKVDYLCNCCRHFLRSQSANTNQVHKKNVLLFGILRLDFWRPRSIRILDARLALYVLSCSETDQMRVVSFRTICNPLIFVTIIWRWWWFKTGEKMPMIVNRQVPMARTPGHQENNNFAAVSINNIKNNKNWSCWFWIGLMLIWSLNIFSSIRWTWTSVLETQSGLGCLTSTGDHCRSSVRRMGCVRNCQEHYNFVKTFASAHNNLPGWLPARIVVAEDGGFARDGNPLLQVPHIYRSTRWPRVKSFNSNLFLKLVLYLSHLLSNCRFMQRPGELVWVNTGCVHWVQVGQHHHDIHRHYEYSCYCCWF